MSYEQAQRAATEVAEALDELATVLGGRLGLCPGRLRHDRHFGISRRVRFPPRFDDRRGRVESL